MNNDVDKIQAGVFYKVRLDTTLAAINDWHEGD